MDEITIYDIAKKAGVSASTVSRVINNYPYVKSTTRTKVLKLLSETKYVPNETARNLVNQSTKMVGILIADVRTTHHTDGVYYIEQEFYKKGYACLIYNTGSDPEDQASYIQLLFQRKITAVVLMGSIYQNECVRRAIKTYLPSTPVAICNGYIEGDTIYGVVSDEKTGVFECVKLLSQKGRNNIAFISNHMTPSNWEKLEGFKNGFARFIKNGKSHISLTGNSIEEISEATRKLIVDDAEIDAIIYSEDFLALIGMHVIISMGKKIPEDIAVVGINNSKYGRISNPSLTSLDNMLYETSLTAVRNLQSVLNGEHVAKKMIICTKIVERSST